MVYKGTNKTYDFRNFKTIHTFGNEIKNNVVSLDTANIEQANLLSYIYDFTRKLKADVTDSVTSLVQGREMVINAFKSEIFQASKESQESQEGEGANKMLKILTPNQMLKRLPIALAQVKAGNNSESLLNEIRQMFILCIDQKKLLKMYTIT